VSGREENKNGISFRGSNTKKVEFPKYELVKEDVKKVYLPNNSSWVTGRHVDVYRIRALRSFPGVRKGTLGGYVQSEKNLSHHNNCWVKFPSVVCENAIVEGDVVVSGASVISDHASILGNARVHRAVIGGSSYVSGNAKISGGASLEGHCYVSNDAEVKGPVTMRGPVRVTANATIRGSVRVVSSLGDYVDITDRAHVSGNAYIHGHSVIAGDSQVFGNAEIDNCVLRGEAVVCEKQRVSNCYCWVDLRDNLEESLRCQCGLVAVDGKVLAYKEVRSSLFADYRHDTRPFEYKIGEVVEAHDAHLSDISCAKGLHFSNPNYWNGHIHESVLLLASIDLKDIITVQQGKLRCTRATILGRYDWGQDCQYSVKENQERMHKERRIRK